MNMGDFLEDAFNKVGDFHEMVEARVSDLSGEHDLTQDEIDLRHTLMTEETEEIVAGYEKLNVMEIIDGYCDSLVVALGTLHALNISIDTICNRLNEDTIKELHIVSDESSSTDYLNAVLSVADGDEDIEEFAKNIIALFTIANIRYPTFKLKENFYIIHETNMLKSFDTEEEAVYDATLYQAEGVECDVFEVGDFNNPRFIIRRDDGKLLKNREWKEPVLILEEGLNGF